MPAEKSGTGTFDILVLPNQERFKIELKVGKMNETDHFNPTEQRDKSNVLFLCNNSTRSCFLGSRVSTVFCEAKSDSSKPELTFVTKREHPVREVVSFIRRAVIL